MTTIAKREMTMDELASIPHPTNYPEALVLALGCAISFSFFLLILRKSRDLDMMPASLIGGIMIVLVSFIFKKGDIDISFHDILYCIFWGAILNGFMNIVFIFSIKHLFASLLT